MKRIIFLILFGINFIFSQENKNSNNIEFSFLQGNVFPHSTDLYHLIEGHPNGVMINFIKKTNGEKEWHQAYNFPDYGAYFMYQDFKSEQLGHNFSVGALYNFYMLNRHLQFKLCQGVALASNPYDKFENSKNKAFGTKLLANTNIGVAYSKEEILKNIDFHVGLLFSHYSNGRVKSPNSGLNTYLLNLGFNYAISEKKERVVDSTFVKQNYNQPIHYNFVFRSGYNESPIIRSGQKPFYHIGFYSDKRIGRKSALQLGADLFLTNIFKEFIKYQSIAYPEKNIDPTTDYKRVGIFFGHELIVNKISLEAQLGYYVYQPFKHDIPVYDRVGMKYYFTKNVFGGFTIKTHLFLAEALEFGVGYRL